MPKLILRLSLVVIRFIPFITIDSATDLINRGQTNSVNFSKNMHSLSLAEEVY